MKHIFAIFSVLSGFFASALPAIADGYGKPGQLNMLAPASPVAQELHDFHNMLMVIITVIAVFVLLLLLFVIVRYNKAANPEPSTTAHNTAIEVLWTVIPVIILIIIVIPSMKLLYFTDRTAEPEMTLKVTGYQWYWGYEYPDHDGLSFLSYMVPDDEIQEGQKRLLETDTRVVVPVDTNIQLLITAADVLHAWAVPSLGVKMDAIPGRMNETWMRVDKPGIYYGQCSELCGVGHGFMPIMIEAVSKEDFEKWLKLAKEQYASIPSYEFAKAEIE